nr:circumsporozoite protein-like [Aegilops tauschii subsp. strangulata]
MAPKSTKGKGVAKDAGAAEPPKSALAVQRTQSAFFPSTVDVLELQDSFRPFFRKLQALHRARLDKAKSRTAVVEKAEADLQERVAETQDWFREAHKELKAAQGELAKRDVELTMKLADVEKAQEMARNLAAAAEAARTQHEAALNSQEEDLTAREGKLAAMLRDKEAELKLEGLEKALEEAKTREGTLAKELEAEKQLRENEGLNFADHVAGENLGAATTTGAAEGTAAGAAEEDAAMGADEGAATGAAATGGTEEAAATGAAAGAVATGGTGAGAAGRAKPSARLGGSPEEEAGANRDAGEAEGDGAC